MTHAAFRRQHARSERWERRRKRDARCRSVPASWRAARLQSGAAWTEVHPTFAEARPCYAGIRSAGEGRTTISDPASRTVARAGARVRSETALRGRTRARRPHQRPVPRRQRPRRRREACACCDWRAGGDAASRGSGVSPGRGRSPPHRSASRSCGTPAYLQQGTPPEGVARRLRSVLPQPRGPSAIPLIGSSCRLRR